MKTYNDVPLYVLSIGMKTGVESQPIKSYLYIRKINLDYYHYYVGTIEGKEYAFIEVDTPNLKGRHVEEYKRWEVNSKDSIYFTDLELCRSMIKNKELTAVKFDENLIFNDELVED